MASSEGMDSEDKERSRLKALFGKISDEHHQQQQLLNQKSNLPLVQQLPLPLQHQQQHLVLAQQQKSLQQMPQQQFEFRDSQQHQPITQHLVETQVIQTKVVQQVQQRYFTVANNQLSWQQQVQQQQQQQQQQQLQQLRQQQLQLQQQTLQQQQQVQQPIPNQKQQQIPRQIIRSQQPQQQVMVQQPGPSRQMPRLVKLLQQPQKKGGQPGNVTRESQQQLARLQLQHHRLQRLQQLQQQKQLPTNPGVRMQQQPVTQSTVLYTTQVGQQQQTQSQQQQPQLSQAVSVPPQSPLQQHQAVSTGQDHFSRNTLGNVTNGGGMTHCIMKTVGDVTETAARVRPMLAKSAAATQHQPDQQQPRAQFYGHNSNLNLPPDMFLLGCIFLIVEYNRSGDDVKTWTRAILLYGGEVETTYNFRVTHVICMTQKHPLVQQGLRDGKRCITAEWLIDICLKEQVLLPWLALHFPTPFGDEKPCRNMVMSYTGFEKEEIEKVKHMIALTGAKVTSYFSIHNHVLICRRPDGTKHQKAREWGKPCVNVQWLNEILCGHYSCLQQQDSHKYQVFSLGNPLRIDYALVPHLMAAWKVPITVTQEAFERIKSSPPVPKVHKPVSSFASQNVDSDQENRDLKMDVDTVNTNLQSLSQRPIVMISGILDTQNNEYKNVCNLGGRVARTCRDATHLVMKTMDQTLKLLCGISTVKYIVDIHWLYDSVSCNSFVDEMPYICSNTVLEKQYEFTFSKTLSIPNRRNFLKGKTFFLTLSVIPRRPAFRDIIEYAGGRVDRQRRSLRFMRNQEPNSYFVISVPQDHHLIHDVICSNFPIYTPEFVLKSIMRQQLELNMAVKKKN